eukprot:TRINITY_DN32503_c0_g1_i1.p2 TRINITY_DN32503_c0_g1~~TRINITY_DN32503_c0_g1_i1.p2  ORF type:complete len:316 (-),score=83.09 TRINITY_DN32503_c0_g1_i1:53-1000(-)
MQAGEHKLFIGCLPPDISEDELRSVFQTYGHLSNVHVMQNSAEKSKLGHACAFVAYESRQSAEDAIAVLDGKYKIREGGDEVPFLKVSWPRPAGDKGKDGKGKGKDSYGKGGYDNYGGYGKGGQDHYGKGGHDSYGGGYGKDRHGGKGYEPYGGKGGGYDAYGKGGGGGGWGGKGKDAYGGNGGRDDYGRDFRGGRDDYGPPKGKGGKGDDYGKGGGKGGGKGSEDGRLFVGNLPGDIDEEALKYVFSQYGNVERIHLMSGKSKSGQSCAFVHYSTKDEAETAIATLHEKYEIRPGDGTILVKLASDRKGKAAPY